MSIGAFLSLFIGAAVPYTNMIIKGTVMAHNFSTPAALFVFFVFVFLINTSLALLGPRVALSRSELAVVYIMAMLATSVPTIGFTENLLPIIAGLYYYATPENKWQELIHPHVPKWIVPQDAEAITYFYEGLPPGMALPWDAWIEPLFYWCLFILSFYWVSICMMTILRKQWVEYEKLPYPLVQVPLEMIQDEERPNEKHSLVKPYFRNRVMWVGFAVPFLIGTTNAFSGYFPFLPHIDTHSEMRLFRGSTYLRLDLNLGLIGFAYLLSRDVALGFWFFFPAIDGTAGRLQCLGNTKYGDLEPICQFSWSLFGAPSHGRHDRASPVQRVAGTSASVRRLSQGIPSRSVHRRWRRNYFLSHGGLGPARGARGDGDLVVAVRVTFVGCSGLSVWHDSDLYRHHQSGSGRRHFRDSHAFDPGRFCDFWSGH